MKEIRVNQNDALQRVDKFVQKTCKTMPMSLLYKYIRTKRIKINGKRTKEHAVLQEGDIVTFYVPDEFFTKREIPFSRGAKPLQICFEDENILIAEKEKGLLCHPGDGDAEDEDTLIARIKSHLYAKGEYTPQSEHSFAPALCHRIDRNTQGLVVAAKNAAALRIMNDIIKNREIEKNYLAAVHKTPFPKSGTLRSYLTKNTAENKVTVKKTPQKGALTAVLDYEVAAENTEKNLSLLKISLKTGRTHQIRAQLAAAGHPLLGDGKYAVNKSDRAEGFTSQALCAFSLKFQFSTDKGILNYLDGRTFTASPPGFIKLFKDLDHRKYF